MAEGEYDDVPLDPGFIPEGWPIESLSSSATKKTPRATAPLADAASPPPAKQRRLSLSLRKGSTPGSTSTSRFAPPVSEVEYEEAAEGVVPANTKKNNDWGERVFRSWVEERNKQAADPVPDCLLAVSCYAV